MIDRAVLFVQTQGGRLARTLAVTALATTLAACGDQAAEDTDDAGAAAEPAPAAAPAAPASGNEVVQQYAPELQVDLSQMTRTGSGLHIQELQEGTGEPAVAGQTVVTHYTGWLPNGEEFDSSLGRDQPFPVVLGAGQVIPGWEEGLLGIRQGGRRRLVIPPALAYGPDGRPPVIPPSATLVFEVEAVEIR